MSKNSRIRERILILALDFTLFTVLLFGFAYFHHVRIDRRGPVALTTRQPSATPTATPAPDAADTSAGPTPTPAPTIDPNDLLQGKYADRFSDDGTVTVTDDSYQSGAVSITVDMVQTDSVTYYVADIYIKYLESFRAGLALEHSNKWMSTLDLAKACDAIVAISGDFYGFRSTGVVAVRNGQEWRKKLPLESDLLVMYYDGSMETISAEEADVDAIYAAGPYQIWCFGPELLRDGRAITEFVNSVKGRNPRSAIGYFEPGHYCFVLVDGRQRGYSLGMTLEELAQLFEDLGCVYAYNLDG
ncbi:MAG: phosphodiester glycosidase family protein, partial [Clostridia bacterium]|nr:phosphodiester glycosidase family protein [Clostridia bacterium]